MTEVAKRQNHVSKFVRRKQQQLHKKNQQDLVSEFNDHPVENFKIIANCENSSTDALIDFLKLESCNDMPAPSQDTTNLADAQKPADLVKVELVTIEDAFDYLKDIKKTIRDKGLPSDLYAKFASIMSRATNQDSDIVEIIKSVVGIFKDHPDLIAKFSPFLPPGYKIEIKPSSESEFPYSICIQVPCSETSTQTANNNSSVIAPDINELQTQINELQSHTNEFQMQANELKSHNNIPNGSSYININNSSNGSFDYKSESSSGSSAFSDVQNTTELINGFDSDDIYEFVNDYAMPSPEDITYTEIIISDSDLQPLQNGNLSNFDYELITISALQDENGLVNSLLPLEQMMPLGSDILANSAGVGASTSCNQIVNNISNSMVSVAETNGLPKEPINGLPPDYANNSLILHADNSVATSISQSDFIDDVLRGNKMSLVGNISQDCDFLSVPSPSKRPKST